MGRTLKTLLCFAIGSASVVAKVQASSADPAPTVTVCPAASMPAATGAAETFTGTVHISTPFQAMPPGRAGGGIVTFEPGARTVWHTHPLGQTLVVTAGTGLVQQEGQEAQVIRPGMS